MPVEFIEAPYHMGRYDQEVGSGPIRLASTGIAAELGFQRTSIELGESSVDQVNAALRDEVLRVLRTGGFPIVLAGNCNSALGTVAALASAERVGVVWFDAHGDFNTPETSVSGLLEGMSLAIVTERYVPESLVVLAGVRDLDPLERVRVSQSAMTFVPSAKLRDVALPAGSVYVHLDLDVLDPAISPGVNFQSSGGLTAEELEDALDDVFRRADVRALAIANYNPHRDKENRTLHIAGELIRLICELAARHGLRNDAESR